MKAPVILLLGVLVCGVVCDPVAKEDTPQTAEAEYYPGPGRSRDRGDYDRRLEGDYGYNRYGDNDGYRHHDYPAQAARTPACVCSRNLDLTRLTGANGCTNAAGTTNACDLPPNLAYGAYCTGTSIPRNLGADIIVGSGSGFCSCATTANFGPEATFGQCTGFNNNGGIAGNGGGLCYRATCPSDGTINLRGQATPLDCGCGLGDMLYIYQGTAFDSTKALVSNQASGDVTVKCKANEDFYLCENGGILVTSSLAATFTVQSTGSCATGFTLLGNCKP